MDEFLDPANLKQLLAAKQKALASKALMDNLDKIDIPAKTLDKFKNKYIRFNSANDVAEGKEDPLKHTPGNRFVFGANFQMNPGLPVSVDLSPLIGYRVNAMWTIGSGGSIRYNLDPKENFRPPNGGNIVYGFRIFNQHRIVKSIYLHAEWEAFSKPVGAKRIWDRQALAGIGKEFAVFKSVKGSVTILYNFLHHDDSPYMKPVVFRFGFLKKK